MRATIGALLRHPLDERDVYGINQEHRREAREIAEAELCVATIKFNPARCSANGSSKRGVTQQSNVPNAIAGKRQGELLPNPIRANSTNHLYPLAATDERAGNAHPETTCLKSPVSGNLPNQTADDGDHLGLPLHRLTAHLDRKSCIAQRCFNGGGVANNHDALSLR